jgi:hypothetical protein
MAQSVSPVPEGLMDKGRKDWGFYATDNPLLMAALLFCRLTSVQSLKLVSRPEIMF